MEYFISDLHFMEEDVLTFDTRKFANIHQRYEYIKKQWNSIVKNDDTVYILGDISKVRNHNAVRGLVKQLRGNIHLILGDCDEFFVSPEIKNCFAEIRDYAEISVKIEGEWQPVVLSHFPMASWKHMYGMGEKKKSPWIHLHGHVHMGKDYLMYLKYLEEINKQSQLEGIKVRSYNVGIMCPWMDYQPRTLEQIMQRFDKYHFKKDD